MMSATAPMLAATVLLLGLACPGLDAQVPSSREPIDSGRVIRAWVGEAQVRGRLLAPLRAGADSVPYCRYPGPPCGSHPDPRQVGWLVPDRVSHVDVAVGNRAVRGAWIGGIAMTVVTYLGASLVNGLCESTSCHHSDTEIVLGSILVGGLSGGLLGALIGSGFDRMERVY